MRWPAFLLLALAAPAAAHEGHPHDAPGWTLDPVLLVPLLAVLAIFAVGAVRLWQRADLGRAALKRTTILFLSGWAVLFLALASPLHEGGERSFTLHMIEHELIMLVATLLLAAAGAGGAMAWGLPRALRGLASGKPAALWRVLTEPVTATVLQALALVAWHVPALFDVALRNDAVHILQHVCFVLTSLLFWWAMLHAGRERLGLSAACLFVTSLVGGAVGALMAVSRSPWYGPYASLELTGIGLDPTTDQQLAGLIMWVPGGLVHAGGALFFLYRWLKASGDGHVLVPRR